MKNKSTLFVLIIGIILMISLSIVFTSNRYALICGSIIPVFAIIGIIVYSKPKKLKS